MRLVKLNICIVLSCCMFAACSNDDDEKWEPEVAVSLAYFEIDISEYLRIDSFTIKFFTSVLAQKDETKRAALKRAVESLNSQERWVVDSLPSDLREGYYYLLSDYDVDGKVPKAEAFLKQLLATFKEKKYFFAINCFAYEIVTYGIEQDASLKEDSTVEVLLLDYTNNVDFSNTIAINTSDFSDDAEQIREVQLQSFVSSLLKVDADVQLKLVGDKNEALDSFDIRMPISTKDENKEAPHLYEREDAKMIIRALNKIRVSISSSSLGLTLDMLKDLHHRKINVSIGLTVKMAINDNDAGQ